MLYHLIVLLFFSHCQNLLDNDGSAEAVKRRGLSVIRTIVTSQSRFCGKSLAEVEFRDVYKAAIIAVQKNDKTEVVDLTQVCFAPGDVLVLQADDESPLLVRPPDGFYEQTATTTKGGFFNIKKKLSSSDLTEKNPDKAGADGPTSLFKAVGKRLSTTKLSDSIDDTARESSSLPQDEEVGADSSFFISGEEPRNEGGDVSQQKSGDVLERVGASFTGEDYAACDDVWRDLRVLYYGKKESSPDHEVGNASREYLTAMTVSPKSQHIKKTIAQAGLDKLSGLFLVQVERSTPASDKRSTIRMSFAPSAIASPSNMSRTSAFGGSEVGSTQGSLPVSSIPVHPDEPLAEGDILWFAGPAAAISDLRKIPGLVSFDDDELKQIDEKLHDRRLVQAVVAQKGPLVGKTAGQVGFRTRYGAAVIAVHRNGTRVQDHPGNIKMQGGDVLLLEAGPTFISRNTDNQHSFALISEVKGAFIIIKTCLCFFRSAHPCFRFFAQTQSHLDSTSWSLPLLWW
jgi:uncharacterized protein with PhoU and TrkA domain